LLLVPQGPESESEPSLIGSLKEAAKLAEQQQDAKRAASIFFALTKLYANEKIQELTEKYSKKALQWARQCDDKDIQLKIHLELAKQLEDRIVAGKPIWKEIVLLSSALKNTAVQWQVLLGGRRDSAFVEIREHSLAFFCFSFFSSDRPSKHWPRFRGKRETWKRQFSSSKRAGSYRKR
jgi:hypothetical protein